LSLSPAASTKACAAATPLGPLFLPFLNRSFFSRLRNTRVRGG